MKTYYPAKSVGRNRYHKRGRVVAYSDVQQIEMQRQHLDSLMEQMAQARAAENASAIAYWEGRICGVKSDIDALTERVGGTK